MTLVRLCCALALAASACATHGRTVVEPTAPRQTYQLCSDPQFECTPASLAPAPEQPIRVDTNLTAPRSDRAGALG